MSMHYQPCAYKNVWLVAKGKSKELYTLKPIFELVQQHIEKENIDEQIRKKKRKFIRSCLHSFNRFLQNLFTSQV